MTKVVHQQDLYGPARAVDPASTYSTPEFQFRATPGTTIKVRAVFRVSWFEQNDFNDGPYAVTAGQPFHEPRPSVITQNVLMRCAIKGAESTHPPRFPRDWRLAETFELDEEWIATSEDCTAQFHLTAGLGPRVVHCGFHARIVTEVNERMAALEPKVSE